MIALCLLTACESSTRSSTRTYPSAEDMVPCFDALPVIPEGAKLADLVNDDAALRKLARKCKARQQGLIDHINAEMKREK